MFHFNLNYKFIHKKRAKPRITHSKSQNGEVYFVYSYFKGPPTYNVIVIPSKSCKYTSVSSASWPHARNIKEGNNFFYTGFLC